MKMVKIKMVIKLLLISPKMTKLTEKTRRMKSMLLRMLYMVPGTSRIRTSSMTLSSCVMRSRRSFPHPSGQIQTMSHFHLQSSTLSRRSLQHVLKE